MASVLERRSTVNILMIRTGGLRKQLARPTLLIVGLAVEYFVIVQRSDIQVPLHEEVYTHEPTC